jgi:predicted DNA-binding transcriptional regulator AlpA
MEKSESPFLLPEEVSARTLTSDTTRWRREKEGLFPRRVKLSARKIAYRRSDIQDWERDPEGWAERNRQAGPKEAKHG